MDAHPHGDPAADPDGPSAPLAPRDRVACAGLIVVTLLLGLVDVETGPRIGLSLFYLVPIVVAGWRIGSRFGIFVAALAAAAWYYAELSFHPGEPWWIASWNGLTRLGIYVAMAVLTARVRADQVRSRLLLERALQLARTDALTGLANSRWFFESQAARLGEGAASPAHLVYMDADNFKALNDRRGHQAGDAALKALGDEMLASLAPGDVAARLGGDEFALLLCGRDDAAVEALVGRLAGRAREIGGAGVGLGLSAGIVRVEGPADLEELVQKADAAMYAAKHARKLEAAGGAGAARAAGEPA